MKNNEKKRKRKKKRKKARQEPLDDMNKGGIVKKFKGGLMVKPKAAKRGY